MGYYLHAFICKHADTNALTNHFDKAIKVDIGQGLNLVPLTDELYDQINNFKVSPSVDKFEYLTTNIEQEILSAIGDRKFAYVEAEYFGGNGGQSTIVWNNGKREKLLAFGQNRINQVLIDFGIVASKGQDEFSTLGLDRHRQTKDWIEYAD